MSYQLSHLALMDFVYLFVVFAHMGVGPAVLGDRGTSSGAWRYKDIREHNMEM